MATSIHQTLDRWPSRLSSYADRYARSLTEADDFEMSNIEGPHTPVMLSETESKRSSTAPLLGSTSSPKHPRFITTERGRDQFRRLGFNSWRMGVTICASTALTVLIVNIGLTIWASTKNGWSEGLATIQTGSCQKTKDLSLWLHLAINVLSTILLAASNYCMQCLSSPTREEVNRAHSRHIWLDIGVPSVRNLRSISRNRIVLWWLLAFSGIPLHLFYNSAVFSRLSSQVYSVYLASDGLVSGVEMDLMALGPLSSQLVGGVAIGVLYQNTSHFQNMTNEECMRAYGQSYVSAHFDVLAISSDLNASSPLMAVSTPDDETLTLTSQAWMCSAYPELTNGESCDLKGLFKYSSKWEIAPVFDLDQAPILVSSGGKAAVQYCLIKPTEEHCKLQLSLIIMCIVMFCNFVKALCMYLILRYQKTPPLVTIGDAIESFLQDKDLTTQSMCLADRYNFAGKDWDDFTRIYQMEQRKWFSSASWKRWTTCNVLSISTLIGAGAFLHLGLQNTTLTSRDFSHIWSLGFGTVTSESLVNWSMPSSGGLLLTVLVANSPQLLLSFLFLTYNGLYTCMLMANEWNDYAYERKPLRVTNPAGDQRSTYRLQLPYRYGVPLTVSSGSLHWLVSQSLFLARVEFLGADGYEYTASFISTVGYSCIAIIAVIIFGTIVVAIGILHGVRTYRPGIPLVGSCSAAISAACHQPRKDVDAATLPLLWGAVSGPEDNAAGHCCLTSFEASPPVVGEAYGA